MRHFRVFSVQSTGTRFVLSFFKHHGFVPEYQHTGSSITDDVLLVIPQRDPIECYYSHASQLGRFVASWRELIFRAEHHESFLFPITKPDIELEKAACAFVDIPHRQGFAWEPVGMTERVCDPSQYPDVGKEMQFAVDWYGDQ